MSNNLRIIYKNIVDLPNTNLTVSSTASSATSKANLLTDTKSKVWRSGTTSGTISGALANIVMNIFPAQAIGGVVFPFCNLTTTATVRIKGYTGSAPTLGGTVDVPTITAPGTLIFDTGNVLAAPYNVAEVWNYDDIPLAANTYAYGGGTYGRVWIPVVDQVSVSSISIEIIDTANTMKYIEMSRLIVGQYWSPTYNMPFGLGVTPKDLSTHSRMESGDLRTNRGAKFKTISVDLKWMNGADRIYFNDIINNNGLPRPLFISLFPNNTADWVKEQSHQVYGKLSQLSAITHPVFEIYSTQIDIEEV